MMSQGRAGGPATAAVGFSTGLLECGLAPAWRQPDTGIMRIVVRRPGGHNRADDDCIKDNVVARTAAQGASREESPMLSRRSFLGSTLGAGAGMALASHGPQPAAAQPASRRMIVDSQTHSW